jgi:hypothetical protein
VTTAQILYGVRNGELVHVAEAERGLACDCTCLTCGRPLVARKGDVLSHFFAHAADEVNCNPTPESLVHAYAKQQVAKLQRLELPGFDAQGQYQSNDGALHELLWRHRPTYSLQVKDAEVESTRFPAVVPDVLFLSDRGWIAVEVYFRHAVPPEKLLRLVDLSLSSVEIDLSDLTVDAPAAEINRALTQLSRWTWLHNRCKASEEFALHNLLAYSRRILTPDTPPAQPKAAGSTVPSRLMEDASSAAYHAKAQRLMAELRELPPAAHPSLLRSLGREQRLALHCLQIGVRPTQLPANLLQSVTRQSAIGAHTILWQTGLFAKFCMTGDAFTAKQAAFWLRE